MFAVIILVGFGHSLYFGPGQPPPFVVLEGKVVTLAEHLKPLGVELDVDAVPHLLALRTTDAKLYVLIKDSAAMKFFRDATLRGRAVRIKCRIVPGSHVIQVIDAHFVREGRAYDLHYWCEVCAIKRHTLDPSGICECCGGPMERREVLVEGPR